MVTAQKAIWFESSASPTEPATEIPSFSPAFGTRSRTERPDLVITEEEYRKTAGLWIKQHATPRATARRNTR